MLLYENQCFLCLDKFERKVFKKIIWNNYDLQEKIKINLVWIANFRLFFLLIFSYFFVIHFFTYRDEKCEKTRWNINDGISTPKFRWQRLILFLFYFVVLQMTDFNYVYVYILEIRKLCVSHFLLVDNLENVPLTDYSA